jgi:hypothetical protein
MYIVLDMTDGALRSNNGEPGLMTIHLTRAGAERSCFRANGQTVVSLWTYLTV